MKKLLACSLLLLSLALVGCSNEEKKVDVPIKDTTDTQVEEVVDTDTEVEVEDEMEEEIVTSFHFETYQGEELFDKVFEEMVNLESELIDTYLGYVENDSYSENIESWEELGKKAEALYDESSSELLNNFSQVELDEKGNLPVGANYLIKLHEAYTEDLEGNPHNDAVDLLELIDELKVQVESN